MDAQPELIQSQTKAVAKRKVREPETTTSAPARAPASEAATILGMIERLAVQPEVSIERIDQLFALYQKVEADRARRAYDAAFAEMQQELPVIDKRGRSHHGAYGRWEDIVEAITPVIGKHGFAISFRVANEPGKIRITAILSHRDGHREETAYELPADTSGSKNAIQAIGSTTSYGKRYTACALLNVVTREEDDDGNAASGLAEDGPISEDQVTELLMLADDVGADKARFCKFFGVASFADIRVSQFEKAKAALNTKRRANAAKNA